MSGDGGRGPLLSPQGGRRERAGGRERPRSAPRVGAVGPASSGALRRGSVQTGVSQSARSCRILQGQ
eukprot:2511925-Pyramimonas_sp.AAC.1